MELAGTVVVRTSTSSEQDLRQHQQQFKSNFSLLEEPEKNQLDDGETRNWNTNETTEPVHIKRPPNSFMLWSQEERLKIKKAHPEMRNRRISKVLGERWCSMSDEDKKPYCLEAERLRNCHKQEYPSFKYHTAKKKKLVPIKNFMQSHKKCSATSNEMVETQLAMSSFSDNVNSTPEPENSLETNNLAPNSFYGSEFQSIPYEDQYSPQMDIQVGEHAPLEMTESWRPIEMEMVAPMQKQQMLSDEFGTDDELFFCELSPFPVIQTTEQHPSSHPEIFQSTSHPAAFESTGYSPYNSLDQSVLSNTPSTSSFDLPFDEFADISPTVSSMPDYDNCPWNDIYRSI